MSKWSLHVCSLDRQCRAAGAPHRIYVTTPWFYLGVALTPEARYAPPLVEPWLSEYKAVGPGREPERMAARKAVMQRAEFGPPSWVDFTSRRSEPAEGSASG